MEKKKLITLELILTAQALAKAKSLCEYSQKTYAWVMKTHRDAYKKDKRYINAVDMSKALTAHKNHDKDLKLSYCASLTDEIKSFYNGGYNLTGSVDNTKSPTYTQREEGEFISYSAKYLHPDSVLAHRPERVLTTDPGCGHWLTIAVHTG